MSIRFTLLAVPVATACLCIPSEASAQPQVTTGVSNIGVSDSFYENIGVGWSVRRPGFFAQFGGANQAAPAFGGFTPNSGISGGFGFGGNGFRGHLGFNFSQGGSRSISSQSASITGLSGYPNFITNTRQRPFVTGIVPVAGSQFFGGQPTPGPYRSTLHDKITQFRANQQQARLTDTRVANPNAAVARKDQPPRRAANNAGGPARGGVDALPPSSAERAQTERAEAAEQQLAARNYYERGLKAEADGKSSTARLYFKMARRRASGDFKEQISKRLNESP